MKSGIYLCIPVYIYPTHPCVLHSSIYTPLLRVYPIPLNIPYSSVFNSPPTLFLSHSVCIPVHVYPIPPCVLYSSIYTPIFHIYLTPHSICILLCICPSLCIPTSPYVCHSFVYILLPTLYVPHSMCTPLRVYPSI